VLTQIAESEIETPRNPRRERRLWHHGAHNMRSLGCAACPQHALCGGLQIKAALFDCLDFCCGKPATCDTVCRNHPDYIARVREIDNFALDTVPRAEPLIGPSLPQAIPMLYHGSSRTVALATPTVALPLARMFNRRDASARYASHEALCSAFGIARSCMIVLSGTDHDAPIERWWSFGEQKRRKLIRSFIQAGVALTTTPNYSLFIDVPRWDDFHAMKRIAIVHHEFLTEGLPAALHVNGRTETDFRRWTEYVAARPEITHLAYEFTTGTGWAGRHDQHAAWLCELAAGVGRPLTLILRGGIEVLPTLARAFPRLTLLETTSFMKTVMRKRAAPNGHVEWLSAPTEEGAPIDELFGHNIDAVQKWIGQVAASTTAPSMNK
jgi:hypothetical protein